MTTPSAHRLRRIATLAGLLLAAPAALAFDVQGHRGCRGLMPENTMPAFRRAIELGVTTIELDVHGTRDRVLAVHHDATPNAKLCRLADGRKPAKTPFLELDFAALGDLDCGSLTAGGFPEQQPVPGARIPRLESVLELARDAPYPLQVSIEIKLRHRNLALTPTESVRLIVEALRSHGLEERAIVQCSDPEVLTEVRRVAPDVGRALLVRGGSDHERWIDDGTVTILSPKHGTLRRAELERVQELGIAVIPWTVNDPADIRRLVAWGVDGLISDYPDRVLAELAATRAAEE